ncbi:hypothetical protein [Streptomyces sp. NBC_01497]|uniref:hypothetical protein n=1 Tax=Streptomyces sp. NBC_01497 TaxID=2903885 RepID=UPI002E3737BE|nr:hypothetical protein [Streptomyces sp. NBC_01497]
MFSIVAALLALALVLGLAIRTQQLLWRSQSWQPAVASSVGTPQSTLQVRRAILVLCTLFAIGWLVASLHVHDDDTWSDDEILGIADDAAFDLNRGGDVTDYRSSVTDALADAEALRDGPARSLKIQPLDAPDGSADEDDVDDVPSTTRYLISDEGRNPACLTVTVGAGDDMDFDVPDASGSGYGSASVDTYRISARAASGGC